MYADRVCKLCNVAWNSFHDGHDCWVCGARGEPGGVYGLGMTVTFTPTYNDGPPIGPDPVRNVV